MKDIKKFPSWYYIYLSLSVILLSAYLYLTFSAPYVPGRFNLTPDQLFNLRVSIMLPLMAIWLLGTLATAALARYISSISGSLEEKGFMRIELGIFTLIIGLLISWVFGAFRPYFIDIPSSAIMFTVISNYINVFMPLLAFGFIFSGTDYLAGLNRKYITQSPDMWPGLLSAIATVFYVAIIFTNPNRQFGIGPDHSGALYLPDAMLVLTLMLPYVIMWTLGIFAAARTHQYRDGAQGDIYRSALLGMRNGILFIVSLSIAFQALSLFGPFWATADLQPILIAIYLILLAMSGGYIFLYLSARKLNHIETV